MPRFTDQEKEKIREKLLCEGERLFSSIGLRKITIDNLSEAAGISHSAFYAFYKSKEHLFMEINMMKKTAIYDRLAILLEENSMLSPKGLAKLYILSLRKELFSDPIIRSLDGSLLEHISRRISPELLAMNEQIDQSALDLLTQAGVGLKYSTRQTVKATEAIFVGMSCLDADDDQEAIIDLLADALVDKLILLE